ncbi:MAG: VCBS repeat-containing protein [Thermotogae bacterium]|nr:VCBS repeat-containing protein [Thermotogota bacterium]
MIILLIHQYPSAPSWESSPGYYSTGLAVWDINRDDYPDVIVSNGNDMASQPVVMYGGAYPLPSTSPTWSSAMNQYHGHLALGDVDGDGDMDLVVAGFSGYYDGWNRQVNALYLNIDGTFTDTPVWVSDSGRCFGVSVGDANGDGLADFLFSCGNDYSSDPEPARLYVSDGSTLTGPVWQTPDSIYSLGAKFLDVDNDGDLDLFLGLSPGRHRLYLNRDGMLDSTPVWESEREGFANQIAVGDINGDGWTDVVVANTFQFSPDSSRVEVYLNVGGTLETSPSWTTYDPGQYHSAVALGDLDRDGDPDLVVGGWWDPITIYENLGGYLSSSPVWSWQPSNPYDLVAEYLLLSEVSLNLFVAEDTFNVSYPQHVVKLHFHPAIKVESVLVDGRPVPYTVSGESGWLSVPKDSLSSSSQIVVRYLCAIHPDLVVSNWEDSRGNFIFVHTDDIGVEETKASAPIPSGGVWYDVSGRRLEEPRGRGIYFQRTESGVRRVIRF